MNTKLALATIPTNAESMSLPDLEDALGALYHVLQHHARHCRTCCRPIIDPEGNPGSRSAACAHGAQMIDLYGKLEDAYFAKPHADRTASIEAQIVPTEGSGNEATGRRSERHREAR